MAVVSMNYLLEAGVHFGHQTKRWNPKMKEYIYTSRDGIYIIDLQKTAQKIEEAYAALNKIASNGGKVLFVGTRKQAQEATKTEALRSESYFITERWLGGTLTNFRTIRKRIKRLEEIEKMEANGTFDVLPKKEVFGLKKEYDKLNNLLEGIREMNKLPNALFIVDPSKEEIAIKEARKLKIPVFGIVDTNCDPDMVDYVIPANDDAVRAVKLITGVMANAVVQAAGGTLVDYVTSTKDDSDIMQKAVESVKRREEKPRRDFKNNRRDFKPNFQKREFVKREDRKPFVKQEKEVVTEQKEIKPEAKVEVKKEAQDLTQLTVTQLRDLANEKNVKVNSTMKKAELIDALK